MRKSTITLGICSGALLIASSLLFVPAAHGDAWNKKTQVTFHDEVKLPNGVTLPSNGEYVLKLLDSSADRHIVQVMNDREDRVYATILAIPSERMEPTGKTVITFYETPAGEPQYIRTWYYPGDTIGQEFTYPKTTANYLTRVSGTEAPSTPEVAQAVPPPVEAQGATSGQEEAVPAPEPTPTPPVVAENRAPENGNAVEEQASPQPPPQEAKQEQQPEATPAQGNETGKAERETLPGTASNMPLAAALGLISLGAALGIRAWRTRSI